MSKGEDAEYSKNVTFNFQDVFRNLAVSSIRETTLAANQWLSDSVRMQFISETKPTGRHLINKINEIARDEPAKWQTSNLDIQPEISSRQYRKTEHEHSHRRIEDNADDDVFQITLQPMQIRTFVLEI